MDRNFAYISCPQVKKSFHEVELYFLVQRQVTMEMLSDTKGVEMYIDDN